MTTLVLDASVAAKWMLPAASEPLREEAFRVLERYVAGELDLVVPDLFWAECGNIVWKAVRQQRLSRSDAEAGLAALVARAFTTLPATEILSDAFLIALRYRQTVYDCLYVAAAIRSKAQFITADERLANALAAQLPVKWLGAFSIS